MSVGEEERVRAMEREHRIMETILRDEIAVLSERILTQTAELAELARLYVRAEARRGAGPMLRAMRPKAPKGVQSETMASHVRDSELFDPEFYAAEIAHLAPTEDPALHYVQEGSFDGRDPGPDFSTVDYYLANPDVAEEGWPALAHYAAKGKSEGRSLRP